MINFHPTFQETTNRDLRTGQPWARERGSEEKMKGEILIGKEEGGGGGEEGRKIFSKGFWRKSNGNK